MKPSSNILRGELERLFSTSALTTFCQTYLTIDPEQLNIANENKAVYVRQLVDWCDEQDGVEALADAIQFEKKGMIDPRLKHVYTGPQAGTAVNRAEVEGFTVNDKIETDDMYSLYNCTAEADESDQYTLMVINGHQVTNPSVAQRFVMQFRILNAVGVDFLPDVKVISTFSDGRPYLIFKPIPGERMNSVAPLSPSAALDVVESILKILVTLDENGMLHGDIRPEHFWVDQSGEKAGVTVLATGFDKFSGSAAWTKGIATAQYMAPELLRGDDATIASDLYALGCTLFYLISGKSAFSGRKAIDVAANHLSGNHLSLADVADELLPDKVLSLVDTLMAQEMVARPKDIAAVRRLIDEARSDIEDHASRMAQTGTLDDIANEYNALLANPADGSALNSLLEAADAYNAYGAAVQALEEASATSADPNLSYHLLSVAADTAFKKARDYDMAANLYDQLAQANPADPAIFDARVELQKKRGNYDMVLEMLGSKVESVTDPHEKIAMLLNIAQTLENEAGEPAKAFDYYLACLTGGEGDKEIISSLEKIGQKEGRVQELIDAAGNTAGAAESTGNVDMIVFYYQKLGAWYLNLLNQPAVALTCYQKVAQYDPKNEEAMDAIVSLYRNAQQWMELAQVLAQRAEAETLPENKRKYLCETAAVYFEKMGEAQASRDILVGVLQDDPGNTKAASLLTKIYEQTGDYSNLVTILEESITSLGDGEQQVEQRYKLAELYELHIKDPKSAAKHYKIAAEFNHVDSLKGMERVCSMLEDFAGLRVALEKQLTIAETAKQKMQLQERLAKIYEEEFKEFDRAAEALESVVSFDPENAAALGNLARYLRKLESYARLAEVLHQRAKLATSDDEKRNILKERVDVIKEKLNDPQMATEAVNELAELGGGGTVLSQIVRSQIELGEYDAAEKTYHKMIADAEDIETKVDVMVVLAGFQLTKMQSVIKAEATLAKAKDLAPQNIDVISEYAEVMVAKGDYAGALELYKAKVELVQGSEARASIFARMGIIAFENIQDDRLSTEYLEQAIAIDSSNVAASDKLAGLYRKAGRWEDAVKIYERWIPSAASLPQESQLELYSFAGEAYVNVDRKERALELFKKAAELANEPALMKRLGDVALEMEEWELAHEQYERYSEALTTEMDNDEKVELFVKRGRAAFGCEMFDEAAKLSRQATVMAPEDIEARILLADVHEHRKDYRGAVESRQKVLEALDTQDERWFKILRVTASLMFEKLRNPDGASAMLNDALKADPKNRDILGELLKMHYAAKKYKDVVSVILQIADLVEDNTQKSRYYLTVAKVFRRELRQLDQAVEYFNKALEHDPSLEDARNALIQVLTEKQDWEGLEKVYKNLIAALPKDATKEDRIAVFKPLADLYMTKLDRESEAIVMFETLSKIDPGNLEWDEKLVELYSWNTKVKDKAISVHHKLLRTNPKRTDSYRMLYRIFSAAQEPDMAWCAASMLSLLNQASPEERQYYKDYLSEGYPPISDSLSEDKWTKLLIHKDMNLDISNIYSVILPAIQQAYCKPLNATGLDPAMAVDVTTDPSEFSKLANFGVGVTAIPPVPLFYQTNQQGFGIVETIPPVMIAGGDAAEMRDYLGLAFKLGQQLTMLRPGLIVKQILKSGTDLSSWLLAAVKIFVPQLPVPNNLISGVNEKLAPIRNALNPQESEKLQGYVQSFVSQAADVNTKRWAKSVDYTGDRAGLLLCGDVAVAMRIIESQVQDEKERAERIKELSLFMVSSELFELRKKLGVALQAG
ncbi:MAG: tetratricopeptide repeat protein [Deltaproteobacteria bacterium]|nr:tetratricopeptide repeat protein [Deltaproteobacteria bacterium]MBN2674391.1 tetratricopeptide repeat protein [Deltaproteobacteria bacterium]